MMVGFSAQLSADQQALHGTMTGPCSWIRIARDDRFQADGTTAQRSAGPNGSPQAAAPSAPATQPEAAQPVTGQPAARSYTADLSAMAGSWEGGAFLAQFAPMRVALTIEAATAGTDSALPTVRYWEGTAAETKYTLVPDGPDKAIMASAGVALRQGEGKPSGIGTVRLVRAADGQGERIILDLARTAQTATLTRAPQAALPGLAEPFGWRCSNVYDAWLQDRDSALAKGQSIQSSFQEVLPHYDPIGASRIEMFSNPVFSARLGVPFNEITDAQFTTILGDLRLCTLTRNSLPPKELMQGLMDVDAVIAERTTLTGGRAARY